MTSQHDAAVITVICLAALLGSLVLPGLVDLIARWLRRK